MLQKPYKDIDKKVQERNFVGSQKQNWSCLLWPFQESLPVSPMDALKKLLECVIFEIYWTCNVSKYKFIIISWIILFDNLNQYNSFIFYFPVTWFLIIWKNRENHFSYIGWFRKTDLKLKTAIYILQEGCKFQFKKFKRISSQKLVFNYRNIWIEIRVAARRGSATVFSRRGGQARWKLGRSRKIIIRTNTN